MTEINEQAESSGSGSGVETELGVVKAGGGGPRKRLSINGVLGAVIGGGLLVLGIGAVLFVDWNPTPPPPPELVRPVKTAVARDLTARPARQYVGQVLPGRTVDLAFQVSGPLLEAELDLGRQVEVGDVLARIDPSRFKQEIETLRPKLNQAENLLQRIEPLVKTGAASERELLDARTARDQTAAELVRLEQALADTVLKAPFEAMIVARMAENFQNVQAGSPVVRLQDISVLRIAVDLPESVVASYRGEPRGGTRVVFPVRPGESYAVTLTEASAEANPQTGTYRAIYSMPRPEEFMALPGMSATIILPAQRGANEQQIAVPIEALRVDAGGRYQVWLLSEFTGGSATVSSVAVEVEEIVDRWAILKSGLAEGAEVATAGVSFLREGQRVKRLGEKP